MFSICKVELIQKISKDYIIRRWKKLFTRIVYTYKH